MQTVAREDLRPESDVDILVDFEPDAHIGLVKFAFLSEELESLAGRKVDLVTKTGLKQRHLTHASSLPPNNTATAHIHGELAKSRTA